MPKKDPTKVARRMVAEAPKKVPLHRPESHAPGLPKSMRMPTAAEKLFKNVLYQKSVLAG